MDSNNPSDKMKKSIRNVFWLYFALFSAVVIYLAYFMLVSSKHIVNDAHNPRLSVLDNEMKRGAIYDSNGYMLVNSEMSDEGYKRKYYYDDNLCHLLGYVNRGKSGIEARYNFQMQKLHNELWQRISRLITGSELLGNSLALTINLEIQKAAYEQLGVNKGAVVVMEPDTGRILAMASYPGFNSNTVSENWSELDANEESPFLNRATQGLYTPGSIFKIITAAAVIENDADFEEFVFECVGEEAFKDKIIHCFDGKKHGEIDIYRAFAYSCNTFFAEEGCNFGAEALINSADKRYFNQPLGYGLEYSRSIFQLTSNATDSEIVETSIGQGRTLVSPLHMAMITSAIANDGIMMQPYVVDCISSYSGREVSRNLPVMLDSIFTLEQSEVLRDMMRQSVEYGTGSGANIENAFVAGKTGTAENPNGTSHSWFTSFAEKDGKKAVVTVVLENPKDGQTAVPVARRVIQAALNHL